MAPKTIRMALAETLENLSKYNFKKFLHQLLDRRAEPRVSRNSVEGKSYLDIVDVLVSTFTEPKALQVAVKILTQMHCTEEAQELESKTKVCLDKGDPTFRKTPSGELETKPSEEALKYAADQWPLRVTQQGGPSVKKPEEVEAEAKARVDSEGGDSHTDRLVLSRFIIQFGKYKGQTFKWLLENDLGWTTFLVADHQKEREQMKHQDPLMSNKDSLTRYAIAYPEALKEVRLKRAYSRSLQSGPKGMALVGFGAHGSETLKGLYESKDENKISYVQFLRSKKLTCDPGSKMEVAVKYILKRDRERAAAGRRLTKRKWAQSARGQENSASRPMRTNVRRGSRRTQYPARSRQ